MEGFAGEGDLLGGLTASEVNFYIGRPTAMQATETAPSLSGATLDTARLLKLLSAALTKAVNSTELDRTAANALHERNEQLGKGTPFFRKPTTYNLLPGELSLHTLSNIVGQVCNVDSGAAARLVDAIITILPVDVAKVASAVPQVVSEQSVTTETILPLVIPAVAAALG